jgi:hypothetical protein
MKNEDNAIFLYYGSTSLWWALVAFSVSYSHTQSVGLLGRGISLWQDHRDTCASNGIRTDVASV